MTGSDDTPLGGVEIGRVRLLNKLEALDEAIAHLETSRSSTREASLMRLRQLRTEMVMALGLGEDGSTKSGS
jgi:hypothetical protein